MRLEKASNKAIKYACVNFHYSKSVPVNPFGFSIFNNENEWAGVIIYGLGANPNLGKPYGLKSGQFAELTRVALNGKHGKTSEALALSIKLIKKLIPTVKLLISFADQNQDHLGIIYQATNWFYTGESKSTPQYKLNGRVIHQRQLGSLGFKVKDCKDFQLKNRMKNKFRYIYPLDKTLIPLCKELSKPYPKNAVIAQGSASGFQPEDGVRSDLTAQNIQ
jgi:hypothetical protein